MDKPSFKLVGAPCGQHGQYTFYKALRLTAGLHDRIVAIGDFFFVKIWQDSELVSIGELQLLWTDRVSDQTLVSLRLYFLPENTPDGRSLQGEDEVLAINEKVVLRAEDLLSWYSTGTDWSHGLRAVWRGACAPPAPAQTPSAPLHHARLDFSDVDKEKSAIDVDADAPGVVVFSYPRYCRYRAVVARLDGIQADWLRDSLVAALGGYAAPTNNTRILYCKDTFEYPELEGHEFVCNHLAPRLKGRPRGRRRRAPRSRSRSPDSRSSGSDLPAQEHQVLTPRRLSLRNGVPEKPSEDEDELKMETPEDRVFLQQLKHFHRRRNEPFKLAHSLKDLSLRALYEAVKSRGGYDAVCRHKLWRSLHADRPARARSHYERFLLPFENHERQNGKHFRPNGKLETEPIDTIDVPDSPLREDPEPENTEHSDDQQKSLRTPSPDQKVEKEESKDDFSTTSKPAEELNREFLESLPKPLKINVKPVEKLIEPAGEELNNVARLFNDNKTVVDELAAKYAVDSTKVIDEITCKRISEGSSGFLSELATRLSLANADTSLLREIARAQQPAGCAGAAVNGHGGRPGRSSLRSVRVKPGRPPHAGATPPTPIPQPGSASSSPPVTNFGIHHPPPSNQSDDEIVEVPYKPKTPEIIDLDEYPESPQAVKKKKLEILKERGLEVTALPPTWGTLPSSIPSIPLAGSVIPPPIMLNPAMQHQIMTQASLFQMYNIIPQNYANGIQPPKVIQSSCTFGTPGAEKTVYGNPKDPFMPPPHVLHGVPIKPQTKPIVTEKIERPDVLDLTCKSVMAPNQKPAVEIVRIPSSPSPSKTTTAQNLTKNYTVIDGKAVVGSNLEITLVNKAQTPSKNRPQQKRSSNGKFVSTKTPTPPKDYPKPYHSPSGVKNTSPAIKKPSIIVPNYQIRDDVSPTSSTGSRDSTNMIQSNLMQNALKNQNIAQMMSLNELQKGQNLAQMMDMQKSQNLGQLNQNLGQNLAQIMEMQKGQNMSNMGLPVSPFIDPVYMSALYSSLAGQMDQRQLAMYRDLMTNQFRGYSGLLGGVATPTTKN